MVDPDVHRVQHGQTGLGIVCAVGVLFCGIGALVTFVVGWMNSSAWEIQNIMLAWTGCIVGGILLNVIALAMGVAVIEMPAVN